MTRMMAVARTAARLQHDLRLGNLDARRDWGCAPVYVERVWRMLQADDPDDYVLPLGTSYSAKDFVVAVFTRAGLDWEEHVRFEPRKATAELGRTATTHTPQLAGLMVDADREALQ